MLTKLKNLQKNNPLTKRVFVCPNCRQSLRVPIKPMKVLRITCSSCKSSFDLSYKVPFLTIFKWNKNQSFQNNLQQIKQKFLILSKKDKIIFSLFLFSALLFLKSFLNLIF